MRREASMGPQLYRCGNDELRAEFGSDSDASMGPQLYRCGNMQSCHHFVSTFALQWGRNFIVAETRTVPCWPCALLRCFNGAATLSLRKLDVCALMRAPKRLLQWGRNFIVAETGRCSMAPRGVYLASMGPQLYRCGNDVEDEEALSSFVGLQWGRNFIVAETFSSFAASSTYWCFNGAATLSLRKHQCQVWHLRSGSSFNGAATLSLRKRGTAPGRRPCPRSASMGPQLYRCGN